MKKIFCLFLFGMFFFHSSFASDEFSRISLPLAGFHLSLDGYYVENVINAMDEDTLIGYVQTGRLNSRRVATFTTTITDAMGRVLKTCLPQVPGAIPLLIRINKLEIFEITSSNQETAFAVLNISFYRNEGNKLVWMYDAGTLEHDRGLTSNHNHPENILSAITSCFEEFKLAIKGHYCYEKAVTGTELTHNPVADPSVYPIFSNKSIPKGLFFTFGNFRDCRPDTTFDFVVNYSEDKDTSVHKAGLILPDKIAQYDIWGFSDGRSVYKKIRSGYFYRLTRGPGSFISNVGQKDLPDLGSAFAVAGMLGGIIGVAFVDFFSSASYKTAKPGEYRVDFSYDGSLVPSQQSVFMDFDPHLEFLLNQTSDAKDSVCLFINNEYHVKLARGFYYSVSIPHRYHRIKLEMLTENGTRSEDIIPMRYFWEGLYVIRITQHNKILMEHIGADMSNQLMRHKQEWNTALRGTSCTEHDTR